MFSLVTALTAYYNVVEGNLVYPTRVFGSRSRSQMEATDAVSVHHTTPPSSTAAGDVLKKEQEADELPAATAAAFPEAQQSEVQQQHITAQQQQQLQSRLHAEALQQQTEQQQQIEQQQQVEQQQQIEQQQQVEGQQQIEGQEQIKPQQHVGLQQQTEPQQQVASPQQNEQQQQLIGLQEQHIELPQQQQQTEIPQQQQQIDVPQQQQTEVPQQRGEVEQLTESQQQIEPQQQIVSQLHGEPQGRVDTHDQFEQQQQPLQVELLQDQFEQQQQQQLEPPQQFEQPQQQFVQQQLEDQQFMEQQQQFLEKQQFLEQQRQVLVQQQEPQQTGGVQQIEQQQQQLIEQLQQQQLLQLQQQMNTGLEAAVNPAHVRSAEWANASPDDAVAAASPAAAAAEREMAAAAAAAEVGGDSETAFPAAVAGEGIATAMVNEVREESFAEREEGLVSPPGEQQQEDRLQGDDGEVCVVMPSMAQTIEKMLVAADVQYKDERVVHALVDLLQRETLTVLADAAELVDLRNAVPAVPSQRGKTSSQRRVGKQLLTRHGALSSSPSLPEEPPLRIEEVDMRAAVQEYIEKYVAQPDRLLDRVRLCSLSNSRAVGEGISTDTVAQQLHAPTGMGAYNKGSFHFSGSQYLYQESGGSELPGGRGGSLFAEGFMEAGEMIKQVGYLQSGKSVLGGFSSSGGAGTGSAATNKNPLGRAPSGLPPYLPEDVNAYTSMPRWTVKPSTGKKE